MENLKLPVSFCLLVTQCQHLQPASEIIMFVNSGSLIRGIKFHTFTCTVNIPVLGIRPPSREILSLTNFCMVNSYSWGRSISITRGVSFHSIFLVISDI